VQPLVGAKSVHQFQDRRILGKAQRLSLRIHQTRRRHDLETLVDTDKEFRRDDRALDCAELHALDLARYRAELTRRIDFRLDTAAGVSLHRGRIILGKLVLSFVHRRQGELHHIGLVVSVRRRRR
jgi:hypothetical protein